MKTKIFLSILALALMVNAFSQKPTMELTFTAKNNGQYVSLDSIFIKNLTQGGDTTLYTPDTILVLDYIASIGNNAAIGKNSFSVSQNYPNPFKDKTTINLYLMEKEYIIITIRDILGRKLAQYKNTLNRGNHSFAFYSGNEKYYLFTVNGKHASKTIKMINVNIKPTFSAQCKMVYTAYNETAINIKSQKALNNFIFTLGDQLRYIGYAKTINEVNGSDVIEDAPQSNEIYEFEITEGIPCPGTPIVTYEDQIYNTVLIGNQCWLKENLNVGTMINSEDEMEDNGILEKYCYDNDSANCDIYGALYQWDEMMQYTTTQGTKGICPDGWHIPTDNEWTTLVDYLGGSSIAGGKMKEEGTTHWNSPNIGATNEIGFTALAGGLRNEYSDFLNLGKSAKFWTSTQNYTIDMWTYSLLNFSTVVSRYYYYYKFGISVRCFKDL